MFLASIICFTTPSKNGDGDGVVKHMIEAKNTLEFDGRSMVGQWLVNGWSMVSRWSVDGWSMFGQGSVDG